MYEWDEHKNDANRVRHGVGFEAAVEFEWESALAMADERAEYGERRYVAVGAIGGRIHVMVFTLRDGRVRIISLRKANRREVKRYEKTQAD